MIGEHEAWLANNDSKGTAKAKKAIVHKKDDTRDHKGSCWCCGDDSHYKDIYPKKEKAFCKKCKNKGHYDKAYRRKFRESSPRDSTYAKRARSMSKDKGSRAASKSRSNSRGKGDRRRKRDRSQTPLASYSAQTSAFSTTRYSDSESEERQSLTRSRSPGKGSSRDRHSANTKKVICQQGGNLREWGGFKPEDAYALAKIEKNEGG